MKEQNKIEFYAGIKNSSDLRRNLLETSKLVISSMQIKQRIIEIQTKKKIVKEKIKQDLKELKMLFLKLEKSFPENNISEHISQKPTENKRHIYLNKQIKKEEDMELYNLHKHLERIEERLKNLK